MSREKKGILFLTSHLPYPLISGGRLREFEILKGISDTYNIYLVVISKTYDVDIKNAKTLSQFCRKINIFASFDEDDKKFFSKHFPLQIKRIISLKAQKYIDKLINSGVIDLIHLESYYMSYFILKGTYLPVVLAAQNVESELLKQELNLSIKSDKKEELERDFNQTKYYESFCWSTVDKCIALTKEDYEIIKSYINEDKISLIQNGCDHIYQTDFLSDNNKLLTKNLGKKSIIIAGNFQYKPNHDAVMFFIKSIFPKIKKYESSAILYIVGNSPNEEIRALNSDSIKILGRVPNLIEYIKSATVFACPLRIGGGIKVKMLEALACNTAIVTTSIGAQGLKHLLPRPFIVADKPSDFAYQVISLLKSPTRILELKNNAKNALTQLNTWQVSTDKLKELYEKLISNNYEI